MPKWISKDGEWNPAKEKVALVNDTGKTITVNGKTVGPGEPYIYEGPDRAALDYMKEQGVTKVGMHFSKDTEFINRVRQVHNMSMAEYMAANGYDEKTSVAEFEKKFAEINTHQDPSRKASTRQPSGGRNTAGASGHYEGDFGDLSDAMKKVK